MKDTLLYILTNIVDHPEDVSVEETVEGDHTILVIHANPEDLGKIIGKRGRIIMALRDIIKIMATKAKTYVDVEVADGNTPEEPEEAPVTA